MPARIWALLAATAIGACSSSSPPKGRIVVALTIDWEGAYLSPEGLDALDGIRGRLGQVPVTHFVSAAYFTKEEPDPKTAATIKQALRPGDDLAVHLHAWRSLAKASGRRAHAQPLVPHGDRQAP